MREEEEESREEGGGRREGMRKAPAGRMLIAGRRADSSQVP